jgi:hypothetical protein
VVVMESQGVHRAPLHSSADVGFYSLAVARLTSNCCCAPPHCCALQVNDQLPEAFALLGYAFYLQPLIMPIIREMPEGKAGRQALTAAVHSSLLGEPQSGVTAWASRKHAARVSDQHAGICIST